jgi:hypothetical protein
MSRIQLFHGGERSDSKRKLEQNPVDGEVPGALIPSAMGATAHRFVGMVFERYDLHMITLQVLLGK